MHIEQAEHSMVVTSCDHAHEVVAIAQLTGNQPGSVLEEYLIEHNVPIRQWHDIQQSLVTVGVYAPISHGAYRRAGAYNFASIDSVPPYAIIHNIRTGASWVIDTSQDPPQYIGHGYSSPLEARNVVGSITKEDPDSRTARMSFGKYYDGMPFGVIDTDNGHYIMDTVSDPPSILNGKYASLQDAQSAIQEMSGNGMEKSAANGDANVDHGTTRVKVIYQGKVTMGTILAMREYSTGGKEYRVLIDKPASIVWVKEDSVVKIYDKKGRYGECDSTGTLTNRKALAVRTMSTRSITNRPVSAQMVPPPQGARPNLGPAGGPQMPPPGLQPGPGQPPSPAPPQMPIENMPQRTPEQDDNIGGDDDRRGEVENNMNQLEDIVKQVTKSIWRTNLSDESMKKLIERVVDEISTVVADETNDRVMSIVNPEPNPQNPQSQM